MQKNKIISILSTRPLEQSLIDKALERGIMLDMLPFIETETIINDETGKKITALLHQPLTVVFTSMNAVEAVAGFVQGKQHNWKIFCIGHATQKLVKENFGQDAVAGVADSAIALAENIIAYGNISSVVFFCGDRRRDELPDRLSQNGIMVDELAVYKTHATPQLIKKQYDGILFFSPSTVHSFFSVNRLTDQPILFAIGPTTADAIKTYVRNTVITGESPGKHLLIQQALDYYQANPVRR
jgi:uroporphyrinogen-III synthase